ncbi:MAG: hypothetical protein HFJ09_16175 [Lachnospiraceae bacterium]|nr:hypothetical protein [Lachnospiraceae bacterium]
MKYQTVDSLEDFSFAQAAIFDTEYTSSHIRLQLANVTISSSNEHNRDIMDMRTNDLILTFESPMILSILKEGYKIYDANEQLIEEIPDKIISDDEYTSIIQSLPESFIYSIDILSKEHCVINIDTENDNTSYRIELMFQHSIVQWDRFLKKEFV